MAFGQDLRLASNIRKSSNDLLVSIYKSIQSVRYTHLSTEFLNELLRSPEVVSWYSGIEMMDRLELQATVDEVQPLRTVHVHGRSEHLLGKRLVDAQVRRAHGKMTERDLYVQWCGNHVAHEEERPATSGCWYGFVHDEIAKPVPEEDMSRDFQPAVPAGRAFARALTKY